MKEVLNSYTNHIHPIKEEVMNEFFDCWRVRSGKKKEIIAGIGIT
jgi:hypothetical protein